MERTYNIEAWANGDESVGYTESGTGRSKHIINITITTFEARVRALWHILSTGEFPSSYVSRTYRFYK